MKTLGIGVDIVKNSRIRKSINNEKFLLRIFTNDEINRSKKIKNKTAFFSKRFAAKEAFSKALGTGFRETLNFKDISITNNKHGKPSINKVNRRLEAFMKECYDPDGNIIEHNYEKCSPQKKCKSFTKCKYL